jgi:hypothetical protein
MAGEEDVFIERNIGRLLTRVNNKGPMKRDCWPADRQFLSPPLAGGEEEEGESS